MKTTATQKNIEAAQRLLELRATIKDLQAEEKALKAYFSNILENDASLIVNTAIVISKHETTRYNWNNDKLDEFFALNNADKMDYKKPVTYSTLKLSKVGA